MDCIGCHVRDMEFCDFCEYNREDDGMQEVEERLKVGL